MKVITDPNNPVILFIPEAGMYPFMRGLAVLGDAVRKRGGKVLVVQDDGVMLRNTMAAKHRLPIDIPQEKKDAIRKKIDQALCKVQKRYSFSVIRLSDFINGAERAEIESVMAGKRDTLPNIAFRGFPVGKIAEYDFILETKHPYPEHPTEEHKDLYAVYVKNTCLALAIADNMCEKLKPSLFLTFNEYSQCQAVRYSAEKHGVRRMAATYPTHFNVDASRFSIWESTYEYWRYTHSQRWNPVSNIPAPAHDVAECWDDVLFRMYGIGSHIFSPRKKNDPASIFKDLGLVSGKKTIVAYTSSNDERVSVRSAMEIWKEDPHITDVFTSQIEWLSALREFASKRDDIQVVVRIHPREGVRQFGFASKHFDELRQAFKENTPSFKIIWPDDAISSYDLMELADVCLVAWSLMGLEAARIGIPVLACTANMSYCNDDFLQAALTREEYMRKLDALVDMRYTWKHLLKAVRFYHWRNIIPTIDLKETVPREFKNESIWPKAPPTMIDTINDILSGKQDLIAYSIGSWQSSLPPNAPEEEAEAMRKGIRLFIGAIFHPPSPPRKPGIFDRILRFLGKIPSAKKPAFVDHDLEYSENVSDIADMCRRTKENKHLRILVKDGTYGILVHNGMTDRRMSPVVVRLAQLHEQSLHEK